MRQGITTRYIGPTNTKGSRIKATARKANPRNDWPAQALTIPYDYSGNTESRHTAPAQALATKLGWSGLWFGGGNASEDGYHYVNAGPMRPIELPLAEFGEIEGTDWFFVAPEA